jgi:hypothetical protein
MLVQLDCHLALGGLDRPAEVLLTFLFRYCGHMRRHQSIDSSAQTRLSRSMVIECSEDDEDNCSPVSLVEMGGVYQIDSCAQLFQECWSRLYSSLCLNRGEKNVKQGGGSPKSSSERSVKRISYLGHIIDGLHLEGARVDCRRKAFSWTYHCDMRNGVSSGNRSGIKRQYATARGELSLLHQPSPPHKKQKKYNSG